MSKGFRSVSIGFLTILVTAFPGIATATLYPGARFDLTFEGGSIYQSIVVEGDNVLWLPEFRVYSDSAEDDNIRVDGTEGATFEFTPKAPYEIRGFHLTYGISVFSSEYVVQPEDDALTDTYAPGTVLYTSGASFISSTGAQASYTQSGSYSFTEYVAGPRLSTDNEFFVYASAWGGMGRCKVKDPLLCNVIGTRPYWFYAYSSISIDSVTMRLDLVPIPEPTTHALLILGLAVIGGCARRLTPRNRHPGCQAHPPTECV